MKISQKFLSLTGLTILVAACGSDLSEDKLKEAQALVRTNAMCEVYGLYRISAPSLNLMPAQSHRKIAYAIYEGINHDLDGRDLDSFRSQLDVAFKKDLDDSIRWAAGDKRKLEQVMGDHVIEESFLGMQEMIGEKYGYSYPDCKMAYAMSEAFVAQNL